MTNRKGKNALARPPQPTVPDADYWRSEVEWELHAATLLLMNIEPRPDRGDKLKELLQRFDDRREEMPVDNDGKEFFELARIVRLARTAYENGDLVLQVGYPNREEHVTVQPGALLLWARGKGYEIPGAFASLIADQQPQSTETHGSDSTAKRRHFLSSVIEKAIEATAPDRTTAAVWVKLRELALDGEPPFTSGIDAGALLYANADNRVEKFTRNALRKRLQRTE